MRTRRRPNHRLAKIHRNYTIPEVASLFGLHRNTVRAWIKQGLPTCDARRPTLILGKDLAAFLEARRLKNKRTCQPGEIYCVRCREPRQPGGNMADYRPAEVGHGSLVGICDVCDSMIYRRVNLAKLEEVRGTLDVRIPEA